MTDNEIIKAWECCENWESTKDCDDCPVNVGCSQKLAKYSLDLIKRQKAEIEDLIYKLAGVMLSVDKWLDGDELKQDEVNRAATMREKTLQITENQHAEIERLKKESNEWSRRFINRCRDFEFEIQENKKLKAEVEELQRTITELQHKNKELKTAKSEAIKEFAERLTDKADLIKVNPFDSKWAISQDNIDNLVKEMKE